jgi:hypothetical protein
MGIARVLRPCRSSSIDASTAGNLVIRPKNVSRPERTASCMAVPSATRGTATRSVGTVPQTRTKPTTFWCRCVQTTHRWPQQDWTMSSCGSTKAGRRETCPGAGHSACASPRVKRRLRASTRNTLTIQAIRFPTRGSFRKTLPWQKTCSVLSRRILATARPPRRTRPTIRGSVTPARRRPIAKNAQGQGR